MVFQHFSLFEAMTVAENIAPGLEQRLDRRRLAKRIQTVSHDYGPTPARSRISTTASPSVRASLLFAPPACGWLWTFLSD